MSTDQNKNTENTVTHLPVSEKDVEARAREIVESKLAEKRAKELLKEARAETDDLLDRATDAVTEKVTKGLASLRQWKEERAEMRQERIARERAQEIAREELIQQHLTEARRQLEQERQEAEATKEADAS